jgi:hypothetical protein
VALGGVQAFDAVALAPELGYLVAHSLMYGAGELDLRDGSGRRRGYVPL